MLKKFYAIFLTCALAVPAVSWSQDDDIDDSYESDLSDTGTEPAPPKSEELQETPAPAEVAPKAEKKPKAAKPKKLAKKAHKKAKKKAAE